jgi:hypothetical protein
MTPSVRTTLLWILAVLLMAGTVVYQRLTGPTYPRRGTYAWGGQVHKYKLVRSQATTDEARVAVPDPGPAATGRLIYRRFPTQEPWTTVALAREGDELAARLPRQPPAGKVEYRVELDGPAGPIHLPEGDDVVLRYKGDVPALILISHVSMMFFGVLLGLRCGLAALWQPDRIRRLTFITLGLLTVGGMVLGPIVQKYAFGAYWTGWPFGMDLTDNKTLFMWGAWIVAFVAVLAWRERPTLVRWTVGLATVVMIFVYLVPHSMRGSQLNYQAGAVQTAPK